MTILTTHERNEILSRWRGGEQTQAEIALDFQTTQSAVSKVIATAKRKSVAVLDRRRVRRRRLRPRIYFASQLGARWLPLNLDFL